jgi:hypothetical protein
MIVVLETVCFEYFYSRESPQWPQNPSTDLIAKRSGGLLIRVKTVTSFMEVAGYQGHLSNDLERIVNDNFGIGAE